MDFWETSDIWSLTELVSSSAITVLVTSSEEFVVDASWFSASVFSTNMWFFIGFYLYFIRELNYKKKIKKWEKK